MTAEKSTGQKLTTAFGAPVPDNQNVITAGPRSQQQVLFENTARGIHGAPDQVVQRHILNCTECDPQYGAGAGVAAAIAALG